MTGGVAWTDDQVAELRRLYSDKSNKEIATLFGVSTRRILTKAHQLGLHKSEEYLLSLADVAIRRLWGNAFHWRPVGCHRINRDGTLQCRISKGGKASTRWRSVHELIWVEANGPIPPGHMLVFKQGMRTAVLEEITLDRIECITVTEHIARHSCNNLPPELREIVHLRGQLTKQINRRIKNGTEH